MQRWMMLGSTGGMMGGLMCGLLAGLTAAQAGERLGYVTAESRYGTATASGPVRQGPRGLQVQTPGGTWFDCSRGCSDTLRRETVDFWQTHNGTRNAESDGPGYFRWRR